MPAPSDPKQPLLPSDAAAAHSNDDDPQPRWTPQGTATATAKKETNPFANDDDAEAAASEPGAEDAAYVHAPDEINPFAGGKPAWASAANVEGCKPCPYLDAKALLLLPTHFQFQPLLCHHRVRRWAEHRFYYAYAFVVIVLYLLMLFQNWLTGWHRVGILFGYTLVFITPIVACELTRMDRVVFGRLVRTFEWGWLFLNILAVQCLDVLIVRAQPSTSPDEIARMVLVVCLLFVCCLYSFSLDALVGDRPLFKGMWITIFLVQTAWTWYRAYFGGSTDKLDVTWGRFSAVNLQAGCLLTIAAWKAKLVVSLLLNPRGLMMLGAQYVLVEQHAAPQEASKPAAPIQRV